MLWESPALWPVAGWQQHMGQCSTWRGVPPGLIAARALLQRQTLSSLEEELGALGFTRIHRSRLVNRRHVRSVESNDSGDFTVSLSDGRQVAGGRRWREALKN